MPAGLTKRFGSLLRDGEAAAIRRCRAGNPEGGKRNCEKAGYTTRPVY